MESHAAFPKCAFVLGILNQNQGAVFYYDLATGLLGKVRPFIKEKLWYSTPVKNSAFLLGYSGVRLDLT